MKKNPFEVLNKLDTLLGRPSEMFTGYFLYVKHSLDIFYIFTQ